jgi:hypothetical protein
VKRRYPYRNGIVKTDNHPNLLKGQVIEIIEDCGDFYKVRVFINAQKEEIKKEDVLIN